MTGGIVETAAAINAVKNVLEMLKAAWKALPLGKEKDALVAQKIAEAETKIKEAEGSIAIGAGAYAKDGGIAIGTDAHAGRGSISIGRGAGGRLSRDES